MYFHTHYTVIHKSAEKNIFCEQKKRNTEKQNVDSQRTAENNAKATDRPFRRMALSVDSLLYFGSRTILLSCRILCELFHFLFLFLFLFITTYAFRVGHDCCIAEADVKLCSCILFEANFVWLVRGSSSHVDAFEDQQIRREVWWSLFRFITRRKIRVWLFVVARV